MAPKNTSTAATAATALLPQYITPSHESRATAPPAQPSANGLYTEAGVYRYERNRGSHEFFSPGPHSSERTVTAPSAIFNLASTIVGGGVLSLPYAFDKCGLVLTVVFMVLSAAASNFSLYVIVSCSRRGGATTYEEIVRKALGPKAGLITVTLLVLLTFLTMVAYVILVKDLVGSLGEQFLFARAISVAEKNVLTLICMTLILPVLFTRSMDALRFTSMLSLMSVLLLATAITIRAVNSLQSHEDATSSAPLSTDQVADRTIPIKLFPTHWQDPVFAFPIISISFLCHFNVLPVYRELREPTRQRLKKIVSATMFSTWVFYMLVGTMGYLFAYQLPGGVRDDILNNFSGNDTLVNVGRLGLLLTIMMNMPLIMQPCRMNIVRLSKYVIGFVKSYTSRSSSSPSSNGESIALLTTPTLPGAVTPPAVPYVSETVFHVVLTVAIIGSVLALAIVTPGVAVVWNMVGSTVGILISYVLPCVSYIRIRHSKRHSDKRKLAAWIILVVSSMMCVACTLQSISSVVGL
ncbi:Sodium-coupled neutral amino acid transporter, partial [Globisporangium splendens]